MGNIWKVMMEWVNSPIIMVPVYHIMWRHILDGHNLYIHCHEHQKSYKLNLITWVVTEMTQRPMDISIVFSFLSLKYLQFDKGIFCRVRRLAWCDDPESYAGGSVATGRATLAGQVEGEHPDKEGYTGPPGWGLGQWTSILSPEKNTHAKKPRQRPA